MDAASINSESTIETLFRVAPIIQACYNELHVMHHEFEFVELACAFLVVAGGDSDLLSSEPCLWAVRQLDELAALIVQHRQAMAPVDFYFFARSSRLMQPLTADPLDSETTATASVY